MNKTHEELKYEIQKGNTVLFLGQGVSEIAGMPPLHQLASELSRRIGCSTELTPERIMQFYENTMGRRALIDYLREKLDTRKIRPCQIHFLATQVPTKVIVTTAYDTLLEAAFRESREKFNTVTIGTDLPYWDEDTKTVIKMYGALDSVTTLTVTESDHHLYFRKNELLCQQLRALLVRRTFLFIGYDPYDIAFRQIYDSVGFLLAEHQRRAYILTCGLSRFDIDELTKRNFIAINHEAETLSDKAAALALHLAEYVEWGKDRSTDIIQPISEETLSPALRLANEVKGMLLAMGHSIVPSSEVHQFRAVEFIARSRGEDRSAIEFVAQKKTNGVVVKRLYRCIDGSLGSGDIRATSRRLEVKQDALEAWLITYREGLITPQARQEAELQSKLRVMSIAGFYREMVNFDEYLRRLIDDYETGEMPRYWVDLACHVPQYDETRSKVVSHDTYEKIDDYVDSWIDAPSSNHISILGDFGTGKTWFCTRYAAKLAKLYLADPEHRRIPILIPLREFKKTRKIEDLITAFLINTCHIDLPGGFATFLHLNRYDGLVLILDGFDEMTRSADYATTVANFEELTKVVESGTACKVILTCRTSYFRTNLHEREVLGGEGQDELLLDLKNRPNFDLVYLQELDESRIKDVLRRHAPEYWEDAWSTIQQVYDLPNLAQRPVLLKMIIDTLDELKKLKKVNKSILYDIYTSAWIKTQVDQDRTLAGPEQKRAFMQELAWIMYERNDFSIHFKEISDLVIVRLGLKAGVSLVDRYENDLRAQSFLVRTGGGYYAFAHTSFMEFFVAQKLQAAIIASDFDTLGREYISDAVYSFLEELLDVREAKDQLLKWVGDPEMPITTRRNSMVFLAASLDEETVKGLREIFRHEGEISIALRIAIAVKDFGQPDLLQMLVENLESYDQTTGVGPTKKLGHSLSLSRGQNLVIEDEHLLQTITSKLCLIANEHMKRTLLLVLGRSRARVASNSIAELLANASDLRTKRYAIAALGKIGARESLPIVQQYLKHESDILRKDAEAASSLIESAALTNSVNEHTYS